MVKDSVFQEEVSAHLWFDNAPVTILSSVHEVGSERERRRKRPGKSTSAKKAQQAFGEEQENDMISLCIDEYNRHKWRVDQLRCYYDL